jgi:hypothetical protein
MPDSLKTAIPVFAALCASVLAGCGSNGDDSTPLTGPCSASFSDIRGSNVASSRFQANAISGNVSGADGSSTLTMVCAAGATLSDIKLLAITVTGARPATGVTYTISDASPTSGNTAVVEYGDDPHGHRVWLATSGTVKVDSVARETVGFTISGATMAPEAGKSENTATGTFTLSGSGVDSDLLGFSP